ncbi:hypothetical protein GUITHDRAFT_68146, partial [Guillardia theta CCMP2712]
VYLNVYSLTPLNKYLSCCGICIFHSSIEVFGVEIAFGGHANSSSGIFESKPFYQLEQIFVCYTRKTYSQLQEILAEIAPDWPGNGYDLLRRNCNHFSATLTGMLAPKFKYPNHINRIARVASSISCCLPSYIAQTEFPQFTELWEGEGR